MTSPEYGFFIERLIVRGRKKADAELAFKDGLNVIAGASDTGKSYALSCIDFALGASESPRLIPQASGYDHLILHIRSRASEVSFEIHRGLGGGDVRVRKWAKNGQASEEVVLPVRHDSQTQETLSGFLLNLCGLYGRNVRKNIRGEARTISFRDLAFLALVDEERIIAERSPQLSANSLFKTPETDVFRLLILGAEAGQVIGAATKKSIEGAKAQLQLVQQLISKDMEDLNQQGVSEGDIDQEITLIENARRSALLEYEDVRVRLAALERELANSTKESRDVSSRLAVVEGLIARFDLLSRHYDSDIARLSAIEQAGVLLEMFPAGPCPVCGAPPNAHQEVSTAERFSPADVRAAAQKEKGKIDALRRDLTIVLKDLTDEKRGLTVRQEQSRHLVSSLESQVNDQLHPRMRTTAASLNTQAERLGNLLRAKTLVDRLHELRNREVMLTESTTTQVRKVKVSPTTAETDSFSRAVEELLGEWNYPDRGRVVFSEDTQDLIIGGQPRTSHGKGVRALTCAAFVTGLLRYCRTKHLPHPSFVALDSPLVAYREPETRDAESQRIRHAGVKEAFYRSLAQGGSRGQVIVFENDDPPPGLPDANITIFTKSNSKGRYGFFPTIE